MERRDIIRIVLATSIGTVLTIAVCGFGGYVFYSKYAAGMIKEYRINRESRTIAAEVGKVVLLPADERPQVAKITDAEELKRGDRFFAKAKDGNVMLYYEKSGIIILFDLESQKLLNMGTLGTTTAQSGIESGGIGAMTIQE